MGGVLIAVLSAAATTATAVLVERWLRRQDEDLQGDGPIVDEEPPGPGPMPIQHQPPSAPSVTPDVVPRGGYTNVGLPAPVNLASFPMLPTHGELHRDPGGLWWSFSNALKLTAPTTGGWKHIGG